nr:glycoside hydrolase family 28 protein [Coralloluteibacterium stylophorae]
MRIDARTAAASPGLDVRDFGAVGDGRHDDTAALQAALSCCPEGGTVLLPAGTWLSGPLFLRSRTVLHLQEGAGLLGHPDIARWPLLPATLPGAAGARVLGSWEGRPAACHASLLNVIDAEDVRIEGDGTIDANASFATWWSRPKTPFAGWRPRTLLIAHARRVAVEGLTFRNAPAWTVHALRSRALLFARLTIEAPADSPNTDGIDPESCEDVRILGCRIDTGDDCIAVKSGKPGSEGAPPPSRGVRIGNCLLQRGHGAVVLGSECAGGIHDVEARDCVFDGTDRGLRIKTRRGRGRAAVIAGVRLANVRMRGVGTPFVVNSFYWCDPDGREPHVGDRAPRPIDAGTPTVRDIALEDVDCAGVAHAAAYVLGLPERPVEGLRIDGLRVRYADAAAPGHPDMAEGIPALRRAGLTFENVRGLALHGIDVAGAEGPLYATRNVDPDIHDEDTAA